MLVVDQVVPKGPGDGALEPGDILVNVNGALTTAFVDLDAALDDHVGQQATYVPSAAHARARVRA